MAKKDKISEETITIPAAQFARILTAAVYADFLRDNRTKTDNRIMNMRKELTRYQAICERRKATSGAGASAEPQQTATDADETKTDAGALAIEAEGASRAANALALATSSAIAEEGGAK